MKKLLALVLAAMMLLSVCSVAAAEEKKTLTFWVPQYQFSKDEKAISDADFWNEKFDAFEAENNCEVHVEILPWGDYNTTVYTGLLNNDGPDVVYVTDTYDLVSNNLLLGLDDKLTDEQKNNFIMWDSAAKDKDGVHYTIVMNGGAVLMFYNKDILAEAGVEVPTTWDEFITACKTIKEKTGKQAFLQNWGATTGTSALMTSFWPYYFQAGGEVLNADGVVDINNEAGLATVNFIKQLYDEGIFDDSITAESTAADKFNAGELAFYAVGDNSGINSATKNGINFGYMFSLKGSAGYGTRMAGDAFAVASKSVERGNEDLAVKALVYITSAEVMDDWHERVYAFPSVTKDAKRVYNPDLDALYTEYLSGMKIVPDFEGKPSFEKAVQSNIQLMFMGDLTPEQVLEETMTYYADQIQQ